ncbi:hypothetical protein DER45DRAFT_648081 [Fusarium avenaceum]|nr:hypothetical protein DER45DRAFT_648081 [Fusarium avenaceum]
MINTSESNPTSKEMVFYITISSSEKSVFPAISSDSLAQAPGRPTLGDIRKHINLPKKLLFTADDKSSLEDGTRLDHYIDLTDQDVEHGENEHDERNKKEDSQDAGEKNPAKPGQGETSANTKQNNDNTKVENPEKESRESGSENKNIKGKKRPQVRQVTVKVILKGEKVKSDRKLLDLPKNLLDKIKDTSPDLKLGDPAINAVKLLHEFEALKIQAPTAEGEVNHPYHFTEVQWDELIVNNRALHGYVINKETKTFKKASKPAFKLRQQLHNPPRPFTNQPLGFPSFAINDDSNIDIVEVQTAFEKRLATHGFNSHEIEGSLGIKKYFGISLEHRDTNETIEDKVERGVQTLLYTTYNFPRVTIEFSPHTLEVTDELKWDAKHISSEADREAFCLAYGHFFCVDVTLGARLESSRVTEETEKSKVSEIKNSLREAAGASFQSPWVSGQGHGVRQNKDGSQDSESDATKSLGMAWTARGGDTTLCSNPTIWVNTVKEYKLWRIIDQGEPVSLLDHIAEVDPVVGHLQRVGLPKNDDPNPINLEKMKTVRKAIKAGDGEPIVKRIRELFQATSFSRKDYDEVRKKLGSDAAMEDIGTKNWGAMGHIEKYSLAYYFAYKGSLFS